MKDYYLLILWGDIEPELFGPFLTEELREKDALRIRTEQGDENGIYPLDVGQGAKIDITSFSQAFFDKVEG